MGGPELWSTDAFRAEATEWIDAQLARAGLARVSDVKLARIRPWSMLLRATASAGGQVWFKASGPGTAFEPALYEVLERVTPEFVLTPLGVDTARGWLLLPNGNPMFSSDSDSDDALVDSMLEVLPQYAEFQLRLSDHADALLAAGVTDMRPRMLSQRFDEALAYVDAYITRRGTAENRATHGRIVAMRPRVLDWIERLATAPGRPSLDHNDLHAHNVFADPSGPTLRAQFFDWGDAVVAHPFASMLVGLGYLAKRLKVGHDDPRILRLRDAYLEGFTPLAPRTELVETLELAVRVGWIARALVWARTLEDADEDAPNAYPDAPMNCLSGLLSDSYLADAT
jgi:hypothetical protein